MKEQGIKAAWCITDPPYGININNSIGRRKGERKSDYKKAYWDTERIGKEYFDLMFATAEKHIIFGGNYYTDFLPPSKSWVVWDKKISDELSFSQCELAWTDAEGMCKIVRYYPNTGTEKRIHATQKPCYVIEWIISRYTREGDLILDPFCGSFTTAVACHKLGRHYIGFELDRDNYELGQKRLETEKAQMSIFDL